MLATDIHATTNLNPESIQSEQACSSGYHTKHSNATNQICADKPVLSVQHLSIVTADTMQPQNTLVADLSYQLYQGETLAIVGESGSGKSISSLALLGLLPESLSVAGQVTLQGMGELPVSQGIIVPSGRQKGRAVSHRGTKKRSAKQQQQLKSIRGARIGMIFQEPMTALNPLHTVGKQIAESLRLIGTPKSKLKARSIGLLEDVNIKGAANKLSRYPHQLSGGQRQRVMIAMALAQNPDVLIADEPTTALDVSLQHDILQLLDRLKKQHGMAMLLISHDLNLVRRYSDNIIVMQQGEVIERGSSQSIFAQPKSAYTRSLISQDFGQSLKVTNESEAKPIVVVDNLSVAFAAKKTVLGSVSQWIQAVQSVSFKLAYGTSLGIVGESGSGKTTIALALARLLTNQARVTGSLSIDGVKINSLSKKDLRLFRSSIQMVFQDPFASINPRFNVMQIIEEGLLVRGVNKQERTKAVQEALATVHLPVDLAYRYPHELSGGQRQRVALARALIMRPKVIILDEPTSALDSSTQVAVVELLRDIQQKFGIAFIFISHDINVVQALCQYIMVLKAGKCVEYSHSQDLFSNPQHAYSQLLIKTSVHSKDFL